MKYTLTIPKPCHENWNEMTPTEKGSFCAGCKKEVVDFTRTPNHAIAQKLNAKDKTCGRFRPDQLNREIRPARKNPIYGAGITLGFTSILAIGTPVVAQVKHEPSEILERPYVMGRIDVVEVPPRVITIKGIVGDGSNALPGAHVTLKDSKISAQTDFDGVFSMAIPRNLIKSDSKLQVSHIGYAMKEIEIDMSTDMIGIELAMQEDVMGELVVVRKKNVFDWVKNLFKKTTDRSCKEPGAVE